MVRYRVVCVDLEGTEIDKWIRHIGIKADDEQYAELSQDEVIERLQKGDVFYIRASDCKSYQGECDIELEIEGDKEKPYIVASGPRGYIGNPFLDIGSCKSCRMNIKNIFVIYKS